MNVASLDRFRDYLRLQAKIHLRAVLRPKLDASDVVQQTMVKAVEGWPEFRGGCDAELAAWLRRILTNVLLDADRAFAGGKRDVDRERSLEAAVDSSSLWLEELAVSSSAGHGALRAEQMELLAEALADLPEDQRMAIELHHLGGLPVVAVAGRMGRSEPSVAGLLRRGLVALRGTLLPYDQ